ncbi:MULTISPECIES: hypothetical protein [unclassified Variovorax]|uniref:hypothetical protein n=1 Tax=unclassified Variovorax TaxID=663243 RepID=UPI001BD5FDA9|nr:MULTISPECIES: hypothetical protein [unclassified Variovorax]
MTRNGLLAILRIAILSFAPFGTHAQDTLAAVPDAELAGAARHSFVQRRLVETASDRFLGNAGIASL